MVHFFTGGLYPGGIYPAGSVAAAYKAAAKAGESKLLLPVDLMYSILILFHLAIWIKIMDEVKVYSTPLCLYWLSWYLMPSPISLSRSYKVIPLLAFCLSWLIDGKSLLVIPDIINPQFMNSRKATG